MTKTKSKTVSPIDDVQGWEEANPERVGINEENPIFEGVFLDTYLSAYTDKRDGEEKSRSIHIFSRGSARVEVWGSAAIDKVLAVTPVGAEVRLEYRGQVTLANGNRFNSIVVSLRPGTKRLDKPREPRSEQANLPF